MTKGTDHRNLYFEGKQVLQKEKRYRVRKTSEIGLAQHQVIMYLYYVRKGKHIIYSDSRRRKRM